jgi:hypothetical protein
MFLTKLNPAGSALDYSILFGGTQRDEAAGVAVDSSGNAYVTGLTESANYPATAGAFDTSYAGGDAVLTKVSPTGAAIVYSTLLGGSSLERATAIAVDAGGNAYVTGNAWSANFPTTPGAFDPTPSPSQPGVIDGFVTKFNPSGSALVYSTILGANGFVIPAGIALGADESAYVTGTTTAADFPTTPGAFDLTGGGPPNENAQFDGFVTKLNPSGSALGYSTYLGGADADFSNSIAVDSAGRATVTGSTESDDFPTTAGAFDTMRSANPSTPDDVFVTRLNPTASNLLYSTYLGASGLDSGAGIAIDGAGKAYVVGRTASSGATPPDFPRTAGAFNPGTGNSHFGDAFVTKLSMQPDGYARPKSASAVDVSLVPAYTACTSPNRQHGPPLAFGSCNPPARASDEATLGTPDANAKAAKGEGRVSFAALNGILATPADEADVRITFELEDVSDDPTLTDYTGELRARVGVRITDKLNNPGDNATVTDTTLRATVPCTATGDPNEGASCDLVTTVDAVMPGAVTESKRSVWELGQVQVDDGGADGDADTAGDNTLFMVQGVFVP